MPSAQHERITARSSAHLAISGIQSDIHSPLCPCCFQVRFEPRRGALASPIAVMISPKLAGKGFPANSLSSGLGSNESMCEGPPSIKRKIIFLARALSCGGLAASGDDGLALDADFEPAATAFFVNRLCRAIAPSPTPARNKKSR